MGLLHFPRIGALRAGAALAIIGFAGWTISLTESATAIITAVLAVGVMMVSGQLMRFGLLIRSGAVVALFVLIGIGGTIALQSGALDAVLGVFGKDSTLTGRTYLWSRGIEIGSNAAPFGIGYNAFWTEGRATAEELWLEFHIPDFTGFHFHNTLIEGFVALGSGGLVLLLSWIIGLPVMALWTMLAIGTDTDRDRGAAAILAGMAVLFAIRAFVEIDFFTPYTVGSFLVPFLLLTMADLVGDARRHAPRWHHSAQFAALQHFPEPDRPDPAFAFGRGGFDRPDLRSDLPPPHR